MVRPYKTVHFKNVAAEEQNFSPYISSCKITLKLLLTPFLTYMYSLSEFKICRSQHCKLVVKTSLKLFQFLNPLCITDCLVALIAVHAFWPAFCSVCYTSEVRTSISFSVYCLQKQLHYGIVQKWNLIDECFF